MTLLEVCCGSTEDVLAAERGGADRAELNSALSLGGLTPEIGSVLLCKEQASIPVIAMLRPRAGGFCYSDLEYQTMLRSAEALLNAGADGLAFGFLTADRTVDRERTRELVFMIHSHGKEAVFHRAFDCARDLPEAAEILVGTGVDRVLTSGGECTALLGKERLQKLQEVYGSRLEILAGSGVRSDNVTELLDAGICQVHSSCRGYGEDKTARANGVTFSYEGVPEWYHYEMVSEEQVRSLKRKILQRKH